MKKKQTDIRTIAKAAGVNIATVSRAVNPDTRHKVAEKTLKKIDALVKKLHYTPSLAGRNLRASVFKTIGVIAPHHRGLFWSDYYAGIFNGVADSVIDTDYRFKLIMHKIGEYKWDDYQFRSGEGIDGLIVTHWPKFFSKKSGSV